MYLNYGGKIDGTIVNSFFMKMWVKGSNLDSDFFGVRD